ncbi:MAG: hypothetical protein ACFFBD_00515 [Candidatus Hodarchaeota archaeon]
MSATFYFVQTVILFISAIILFVSAYLVFRRAPSALLNRLFTIAVGFLGLWCVFFGVSKIPVFLWEGQVELITFKLAYSFLFFALSSYLLSALFLEFGEDAFRYRNLVLLSIINLASLGVLWLTDSISLTEIPGDTNTSLLFKLVFFGSSFLFFLLTFYFYFKTYQASEGSAKENLRWFLIGWILGGGAIVGGVFSDLYQLLDLIVFLLLAIAAFIQQRAFRT